MSRFSQPRPRTADTFWRKRVWYPHPGETNRTPSLAALMAGIRSVTRRGFNTKPQAPVCRAAQQTSKSVSTVKKTILIDGASSFMCLAASIPLSLGMEISNTNTSGRDLAAASTAACPSRTTPTTSQPSPDTNLRTYSSIWLLSSAKSTRILGEGISALASSPKTRLQSLLQRCLVHAMYSSCASDRGIFPQRTEESSFNSA